MNYLAVRNLAEYQHYKNRNPPWVKLHVKILQDEHFRELSIEARLLFLLLLAVAAGKNNRIPDDPRWIEIETGIRKQVASKALAELLAGRYLVCKHDASTRDREQRTENRVSKSSTSYVVPERALHKLLQALTDADPGTAVTIRGIAKRHRLAEGDFMWALECAEGPGVNSPSAVAVAELRKRGEAKKAA